jgi:hypothetical protein
MTREIYLAEIGYQDQDLGDNKVILLLKEIKEPSFKVFYSHKNAFYVNKANKILKKNHANMKEMYKVCRFNILKTPAIP